MKKNATTPTAPRLSPRVRAIIEGNTATTIADVLKPFGRLPATNPAPATPAAKAPRSRRFTATRPPAGRVALSCTTNTSA